MESKEAKQLVILGNGFDLNLGLKTKFEDYFDSILEGFGPLIRRIKFYNTMVKRRNKFIPVRSLKEFDNTFEEIYDELHGEKQFLLLKFIIDSMHERVSNRIIDYRKKYIDTNDIKYERDLHLLNGIEINLIDKKEEIENSITESDKEDQKLTFWDIYFLYLKNKKILTIDPNWSDVEKQILNFFKEKDETSKNIYYEMIRDDMWDNGDAELKTVVKTLERHYNFSLKNIDNYLYNELIHFSKGFLDYLNDVYKEQYSSFIKQQCRWDFIDEKIADYKSYELLNFNYTDAKGNKCVKQIHIHGDKDKVDEIPIIGINAEDLTVNKEHAFKLTKQYQLISNENNKIEKLDLENIDKIIFYGHSLALADYQYFRNIFDRINLVESSVQLIFKYSKGYENYDSIFKLLDRYSQDINIDVTTTLTLENRLKVEEIPD